MGSLQTLQTLVSTVEARGDKACILEMQQEGIVRWSCAEVAGLAQRLGRGLVEAGLQRGEVVPILAGNRPEWVVAALAILSAGGVVSPLDTQIGNEALARVLQDSEARSIFTTTDYLNRLGRLGLDVNLRPILFDVEAGDERGWWVLLSDKAVALPTVGPEAPAALFYTSGTTGMPKGVPLTHYNLAFQLRAVEEAGLLQPDDRVLLPLPLYHVYPFTIGTLIPLAFGLPLILPQSLTGPQIIRALGEGEVTIILGVPRIYRAVYNGIEGQIAARGKWAASLFQTALGASIGLRRRFGWQIGKFLFRPLRDRIGPKVRLLTSAGSALDPELAGKLDGLGWALATGYGLTETSPMLTMNPPTSAPPNLASAGRPLPGVELRIDKVVPIEDEMGHPPLPPRHGGELEGGRLHEEGEILARGPGVFSGYRNLPEQTAEAFTSEGWFRTGDLGYLDEQGYLYISGRASTLIVLEGGKKIQPEPLEEVYQQHEFIREIGILYQNNQLVAAIVPELEPINRLRNGDIEAAIREAVKERSQAVASYQRLTDYAITTDPLPRTNLGKIRRHVLAQNYKAIKSGVKQAGTAAVGPVPIEDMSEKDQALLAHPAARQIWEWLASRYPDKQLSPDTSPQLDLGIDSLEWLTLTLQVSDKTGVELSDEAIRRISTVRELLEEVRDAAGREVVAANSLRPETLLTDEQKQWLRPLSPFQQALGTVLFAIYRFLARFLFRLKVEGLEHLPSQGNFVLAPNHTSMLDAPLLAAALPSGHMRQTHWAGAADIMLTNPLMRLISRLFGVLPIERFTGGTGVKNLALAIAALQQDKNLVWFPEGRIAPTDKMLPFREGIGLILDQQPTPVVPVYIQGAREAMPLEATWPKFKPVTIIFGPVCDPAELARRGEAVAPNVARTTGESAPARIVQALQERVAALGNPQPAVEDFRKVDYKPR